MHRSLSNCLYTRSPSSVTKWNDYEVESCTSTSCSTACSSSPEGKEARLPSRNVHFNLDACEVFNIIHVDDIPEEDICEIWYTAEEYSNIKKDYQITIFMMDEGEKISGDDHTSRGLEYRSKEGAWARYENKRDAYNAVLDEQDQQWKDDADDEEKIRAVYLEQSTKCRNAAILRGMQDEEDVKEYLRPKREPRKKNSRRRKIKVLPSSAECLAPSYDKTKKVTDQQRGSTIKPGKAQPILLSGSTVRRNGVRDDIKRIEEKLSGFRRQHA